MISRKSFSLRMLFVAVTFSACALGWIARQARFVHERASALKSIRHCGGSPESPSDGLPWAWRLLGATRVMGVDYGFLTKANLHRFKQLFPEDDWLQSLQPDDVWWDLDEPAESAPGVEGAPQVDAGTYYFYFSPKHNFV